MSTTPDTDDLVDDLAGFLKRYYREAIGDLARQYPTDAQSLTIEFEDLLSAEPAFAEDYREAPRRVHEHLEAALVRVDLPVDVDLSDASVRVTGLGDHDVMDIPALRSTHLKRYLGVSGQVSKVSQVKPHPTEAAWQCQRCSTVTVIPQAGGLQEPAECQGCERQGPFELDQSRSEWADRQLVRLTEPPEDAADGAGQTLEAVVEGDLAGAVDPGDRVDAHGILELDEADLQDLDAGAVGIDRRLDCRAVETEETDYEEIDIDEHLERVQALARGDVGDPYELLVDSIAPTHHGDDELKLALGLQLFGGVSAENPDGTSKRGDSHILLIGDPGSGKSTLLSAVAELAPRSVQSSAEGATQAGMTAAAVPDDFGDSKWSIEAGAMVLADKGVACVDELDKLDEELVGALHNVLEDQTVQVNKAGINTTLPARTALLAAGNPEYGRFDPHQPWAEQIDLSPTLLSRMDLLFMVSDQPDEEEDAEIAEAMLDSHAKVVAAQSDVHDVSQEDIDDIEPAVEQDVLRAWIAHAKQTVEPVMPKEVQHKLKEWYVELRQANEQAEESGPVPVTARKMEALRRLAEASARVRLSQRVEEEDVERACQLVQSSMQDVGIDPESGVYDADIVETGQSRTQQSRQQTVGAAFREHADGDGFANLDELLGDLEAQGVDREDALHTLQKMLDRGDAYIRSGKPLDEADEIGHTDTRWGGDA